MDKITAIWAFFLALGPLVVVHELGHYWVARWCNVKVLRFSVGLGRVLWSKRFGPDQTEWAISMWPIGGYVKMLDARDADPGDLSDAELAREFTRQSVWKRIAIVAAGPVANFLMAIGIIAALHMHGVADPVTVLRQVPAQTAAFDAGLRGGETVIMVAERPVQGWSEMRWALLQARLEGKTRVSVQVNQADGKLATLMLNLSGLTEADMEADFIGKLGLELARPAAIMGEPEADGPGQRAGFHAGDKVSMINQQTVLDGLDFVQKVRKAPGQKLLVSGSDSQGQPFERSVLVADEVEKGVHVGRIKIKMDLVPKMRVIEYGFFSALGKGVEKTWDASALTVKMFGQMLTGKISLKNLSGPVSIAEYAGQSAQMGLIAFLGFVALISISLGVMNLLPIPVLDGGFLLYYSLEVLMGRPLSARIAETGQRIGLGILIVMMAIAFANDGIRHLGKLMP